MCESVFKVLVVGDSGVGKTAMVARYCHSKWLANYKATLGADYAVKTLAWEDREMIRLHMWDLAGQDNFRYVSRTYFRGASGCVVVFDLSKRMTFNHVREWKEDLDSKVVLPNGKPIPCILVGNKDDLSEKCTTPNEMTKFAKEQGFFSWILISVKENTNVDEMMTRLVERMVAEENSVGIIQQAEDRATHSLGAERSGGDSEGCVCAR